MVIVFTENPPLDNKYYKKIHGFCGFHRSTKLSKMTWKIPQTLADQQINVAISVSDNFNEPAVLKSHLKI